MLYEFFQGKACGGNFGIGGAPLDSNPLDVFQSVNGFSNDIQLVGIGNYPAAFGVLKNVPELGGGELVHNGSYPCSSSEPPKKYGIYERVVFHADANDVVWGQAQFLECGLEAMGFFDNVWMGDPFIMKTKGRDIATLSGYLFG